MKLQWRSPNTQDWAMTVSVVIVAFVTYMTTMCRSVSFIDAGELAAVACVLWIAHPTGYPLFTLVAHVAQWFSIGNVQVVVLNGLSALVVALSVGVFSCIALVIGRRAGLRDHSLVRSAAGIASLVLAFSTTVWAQSVTVEVYALHVLLILLTILLFLKSSEPRTSVTEEIPRLQIAGAFLFGLSFANHLTSLLLIPALVLLHIRLYGLNRGSMTRGLKLSPFFALGLSVYLYLPIRALAHPPVQWGYPATLERFAWHVGGKQYRSWMFSGFESASKQLSYFLDHLPSEFNWLVLAAALYGLVKLFRAERTMFWFFAVSFVGCVAYSINYDIHDIDSYFLLAYLSCGVFVFYGLAAGLEMAWRRWKGIAKVAAVIVLMSAPTLQFINNRASVNESDNFFTEDYFRTTMSGIEPNGLIITYQWDYFVSPSLYFQLVHHERPDVAIIDKELLRRSWYFVYLERRFPWLIERSKEKIDAFLVQLDKFEHDRPYDPAVIEATYVEMINDLIRRSAADRPVYVGPEIEAEFGSDLMRIPSGLMFRLAQNAESVRIKRPDVSYRKSALETRLTKGMKSLYARMLTTTGMLFLSQNRHSDALYCAEHALLIDPTFQPAKSLLQNATLGIQGGKP